MKPVDPASVKAFLENADQNNEPQMEGHEVVDIDQIREEVRKQDAEIAESHKQVDKERSKVFEPDKTSLAHLSSWVFADGKLEVEVTDQDKALYIKSLLNDTALEMPVTLELGITMTFRALSNYDLEVVFLALQAYSEENKIVGPAQYASRVQQCAAALQLIKYNDIPAQAPNFSPDKGGLTADVATLRNRVDSVIAAWNWPKWQAIVTALRIFEIKLSLCNENARNANFWQTADAN